MKTNKEDSNHSRALGLHPHNCKICGRLFECGGEYVYKTKGKHDKYIYYCSYSCLREAERKKENDKHRAV